MLKLKKVHVENFKSIKSCTFDVEEVNLLIGPNNAGKTNLLKVFEFIQFIIGVNEVNNTFDYTEVAHNFNPSQPAQRPVIKFNFTFSDGNKYYMLILSLNGWMYDDRPKLLNLRPKELAYRKGELVIDGIVIFGELLEGNTKHEQIDAENLESLERIFLRYSLLASNYSFNIEYIQEKVSDQITRTGVSIDPDKYRDKNVQYYFDASKEIKYKIGAFNYHLNKPDDYFNGSFKATSLYHYNNDQLEKEITECFNFFEKSIPYRVEVKYLKEPREIGAPKTINSNAENIVSYMEFMFNSNRTFMKNMEKELQSCIPDFVEIGFTTAAVNQIESQGRLIEKTAKSLILKDKYGNSFPTKNVSEGTLYFIALLAITLQPDPPKLLMIEEPETGIHPRRIKEVLDYIMQVKDKNPEIQIIISTHHPYVVDYFAGNPERIMVIESENGETKVKNLLRDVIEPQNEKMKAEGLDPIDYTSSLGEHWVMGFLGGYPK